MQTAQNILITGGSGLVGRFLSIRLMELGHHVSWLSRNPSGKSMVPKFYWDVEKQEIDPLALQGITHIVHLAGAGIADKRWSKQRKRELYTSRIDSTRLLLHKVKASGIALQAFVSSSATGYYGLETDARIYKETDPPASDFIGKLCEDWEKAVMAFEKIHVRTVVIRTGVVCTTLGGALSRLALPVRMGVGSPLGSGKQPVAWIHRDDLINTYVSALQDPSYQGVYNAVSPEGLNNAEWVHHIAKAYQRKIRMPRVPSWVLRLLLGEMAGMVLQGKNVYPERLLKQGFQFRFPNPEKAIHDLIERGV